YDETKGGWTVTLLGSAANDGQELYVVQEESPGKYATLAKLNVYSYEPKRIKVKLAPVNGFTNGFTQEAVSQGLNAIYNKVGITCEVEFAENFDYEPLKERAFNVTGSGLFSTLTDDMKALNSAYLQANPDEDAICLFVIREVTGNEGVAGDMPRGKQFGYLFEGADAQTAAHEIGHGVFHLDHPFARANVARSFDEGDLAGNLMESRGFSGNDLVKLQWDAIHSPGLVIGLFQKDKEGMIKQVETKMVCVSKELSDIITSYAYILAPNGMSFDTSELTERGLSVKALSYRDNSSNPAPMGAAIYFEDAKGDLYTTTYNSKDNTFMYYTKAGGGDTLRFTFKSVPHCENSGNSECIPVIFIDRSHCKISIGSMTYDLPEDLCNCTTPVTETDILGNADPDFKDWFRSIGGIDAIAEFEELLYEKGLDSYRDGYGRAIYGTDAYGNVAIPENIRDKVRKEAKAAAFPTIKSLYAFDRSGTDPDGISFNLNPFSLERVGYFYYRALAVTSTVEGYELVTGIGIQVGIDWLLYVIPSRGALYKGWKGWTGKMNAGNTVAKGGSFIAKSGAELKTHLSTITSKPTGVSYKGKMYRNIDSGFSNPTEIHAGIIDDANRFRRGLYTSETKAGNLLEMNGNTAGRTLYEMEFEISGLLDLTDAKVIEHLGTTFDQMKLVGTNAYEFTQEVAIWAKNNGYSGIKFYGAQSSTNYTNFVIFEQTTVNSAITNIKTILW
ncbi:MAG: hypothetical protein LBL79_13935, partial [Prevotella sp.]|nr:hypothetical protein [Prevotella sp.]